MSRISRAHIFSLFPYLVVGPAPSRTWDKSRVRDLSALPDHSNVRDRTGGKLSVSTGLQPVNGWHSICSRGFSGTQPAVRSKIRPKIQSRVLRRCIYRKRGALRGRINGIMMDPLRPVEIHYCSENRLLALNLNSWFPSDTILRKTLAREGGHQTKVSVCAVDFYHLFHNQSTLRSNFFHTWR